MNYQAMGRMVRRGAAVALHVLGAVPRAIESIRLYNEMQQLDDGELAALGILRDRIGRYVAERMDPVTLKSLNAPAAPDVQPVPTETAADAAVQRRAA